MVFQWDTENNLRLAMALLMASNGGKLDFNDWKSASDAIRTVFKGEKSVEACRHQWRKLHKEFVDSLENDGKEAVMAAPKPRGPRKRTSATRDAQGNGTAEPSRKRPRKAQPKEKSLDELIKEELGSEDDF